MLTVNYSSLDARELVKVLPRSSSHVSLSGFSFENNLLLS